MTNDMRSVIGLCGFAGMTVGGFVPALWGSSAFSLASFGVSILGGLVGVWVGAKLTLV